LNKDQSYGGLIFVVSVLISLGYLFGLTRADFRAWLIGVPVVLAVLAILGITAWIGWTMLTTPPPAPLEAEMPSSTPSTASVSPTMSHAGHQGEDKDP